MAAADLPYREGVGITLVNGAGRIFVAKRLDMVSEAWQMPQGGIDKGEAPQAAALRELLEETGVTSAEILAESRDWYYYDLPEAVRGKIWGGKYRGQKQKWFIMRFTGNDAEIDINTEHPEFSVWQWAEACDVPRLIVPFKRKLYEEVLAEFAAFLPGYEHKRAL